VSTNSPVSSNSEGKLPVLPPVEVIFGRTNEMQRVRQRLEKVCATDIPILLEGQAGTGKALVAHWIHQCSRYGRGPLSKLNCAVRPGWLAESELFGYCRGAFPGAEKPKPGRLEMADGGTLLLDHVSDLEAPVQARLLGVLQEGRFCRLGDVEERNASARIICTSSGKLETLVEKGQFCRELHDRISVFRVELSPLQERLEDIPALASYYHELLCKEYQLDTPAPSPRMLQILQRSEWKGNVRELQNRIASYVLLGGSDVPRRDGSWRPRLTPSLVREAPISLKRIAEEASREISREVILSVLRSNRWNRRRAAAELKISYRTLLYKIKEAGLPPRRNRKLGEESGVV
jgi:two-component system response regulator AtoC